MRGSFLAFAMVAGVAVAAAPYVGNLSAGPARHERGGSLGTASGGRSPLLARAEGGAATSSPVRAQFADGEGTGGEGGSANVTMRPRFS